MRTGLGERGRAFRRALVSLVVIAVLQSWFVVGTRQVTPASAQTSDPPNIVLILTDDQRWDSLKVMPQVKQLLTAHGMSLRRAIVTDPLCCPSRATILTGRYAHTTGVYTNAPPDGGWPAFQASEPDTIATALNDAGYRTALIGKYMNGYVGDTGYVPPGWDRFFALSGPGAYFDYEVLDETQGLLSFGSERSDYSTDVFKRQAASFIRRTPPDQPFFLMVTPFAPHGPFTPAPRHDGEFAGAPVSLNAAINEDTSDKSAYLAGRPPGTIPGIKWRFRNQWETLQAVDDLVGKVMGTLEETGRAEETLVIFTSDNGLANREHRAIGKQIPYDVSVRVPMIVRFPASVPAGTVSNALVSNVDLAPTIADFAGVPFDAEGVSMRPLLIDEASSVRSSLLLENLQWATTVPTYCGVRTPSFMFVHYGTGEEELYDLGQDPWQLENVVTARPSKATELRSLTQTLCDPVPPRFSW